MRRALAFNKNQLADSLGRLADEEAVSALASLLDDDSEELRRATNPAERILYHLAALFREQTGEHDLAGRFGGQRFLVVPGNREAEAAKARRIKEKFQPVAPTN